MSKIEKNHGVYSDLESTQKIIKNTPKQVFEKSDFWWAASAKSDYMSHRQNSLYISLQYSTPARPVIQCHSKKVEQMQRSDVRYYAMSSSVIRRRSGRARGIDVSLISCAVTRRAAGAAGVARTVGRWWGQTVGAVAARNKQRLGLKTG